MTQKDKMLHMVLSDESLQSQYKFNAEDFKDLDVYEAQLHENAVISTVAKIIKELDGSVDLTKQKEVYKKIFNYLNSNLLV